MIAGPIRRVRDQLTWLRHTYSFQLAHGPLCDRHRDGVVRLGHVFLCRSCLALYAALVISLPLLLWWSPRSETLALTIPIVAGLVLVASWPAWYRRFSRGARDVARAGAGVLAALVLTALWTGAWWVGGIAAGALLVAFLVYSRLRRAARVHLCDGCPELGGGVCSGYARQVQRLSAYEEVMSERVMARLVEAGGLRRSD